MRTAPLLPSLYLILAFSSLIRRSRVDAYSDVNINRQGDRYLQIERRPQVRDESLGEFDRITGAQMGPLGTVEPGQLGKVGVVDSGSVRHLEQWIPRLLTRCDFILELFQSAGVWKTDKNNLAAARANFFDGCRHVGKTSFDSLFHLRHENVVRHVTRRRWRREKWDPDLLNPPGQFASRFSAFLPHPRATLAIFGCGRNALNR